MASPAPTPPVPLARKTHLVSPFHRVRLSPLPSSLPPAESPALIEPTRYGRTTPTTVMDKHASLATHLSRFGLAHHGLQTPLVYIWIPVSLRPSSPKRTSDLEFCSWEEQLLTGLGFLEADFCDFADLATARE
ncbi:hypothetical protein NL676_002947 [Syzygium grande]|nr:hypothetical protein NL676_002947 [Syzygium grande]